jgi:VIT1/CCC1 family predicted Fe2+/Mn2+ transporter
MSDTGSAVCRKSSRVFDAAMSGEKGPAFAVPLRNGVQMAGPRAEPACGESRAFSTLWASCLGAIVPIAPWFVLSGAHAIVCSLVAAGIAASIIGATLAQESRSAWLLSALRQLGLVLLTSAVTFGIGRILQTIGAAGR